MSCKSVAINFQVKLSSTSLAHPMSFSCTHGTCTTIKLICFVAYQIRFVKINEMKLNSISVRNIDVKMKSGSGNNNNKNSITTTELAAIGLLKEKRGRLRYGGRVTNRQPEMTESFTFRKPYDHSSSQR